MATTVYVPLKSQNKELLWSFYILGQTVYVIKQVLIPIQTIGFIARFIDSTDHQPGGAYYI